MTPQWYMARSRRAFARLLTILACNVLLIAPGCTRPSPPGPARLLVSDGSSARLFLLTWDGKGYSAGKLELDRPGRIISLIEDDACVWAIMEVADGLYSRRVVVKVDVGTGSITEVFRPANDASMGDQIAVINGYLAVCASDGIILINPESGAYETCEVANIDRHGGIVEVGGSLVIVLQDGRLARYQPTAKTLSVCPLIASEIQILGKWKDRTILRQIQAGHATIYVTDVAGATKTPLDYLVERPAFARQNWEPLAIVHVDGDLSLIWVNEIMNMTYISDTRSNYAVLGGIQFKCGVTIR